MIGQSYFFVTTAIYKNTILCIFFQIWVISFFCTIASFFLYLHVPHNIVKYRIVTLGYCYKHSYTQVPRKILNVHILHGWLLFAAFYSSRKQAYFLVPWKIFMSLTWPNPWSYETQVSFFIRFSPLVFTGDYYKMLFLYACIYVFKGQVQSNSTIFIQNAKIQLFLWLLKCFLSLSQVSWSHWSDRKVSWATQLSLKSRSDNVPGKLDCIHPDLFNGRHGVSVTQLHQTFLNPVGHFPQRCFEVLTLHKHSLGHVAPSSNWSWLCFDGTY